MSYSFTKRKMGKKSNFAKKEEEATLQMLCRTITRNHQNLSNLDTGCINHMCGSKSIFSNLDKSFSNLCKVWG